MGCSRGKFGCLVAVMMLVICLCFGVVALADVPNAVEYALNQTMTAIVQAGQQAYFKFIPQETGYYVFYSSSDEDTFGYLYQWEEESLKEIDRDDQSGDDNNFCIRHELIAGMEYYYGVCFYDDSKGGTFPVILEKYTGLVMKAVSDTRYEVQFGTETTLQVMAFSKQGDVTYQWVEVDEDGLWSALEGKTEASLKVMALPEGKDYICVATDGITRDDIRFEVIGSDKVTAQAIGPTSLNVKPGELVKLEVEASSLSGELSYTWYMGWHDEDGSLQAEKIDGADQASYIVENLSRNAERYWCYIHGVGRGAYEYVRFYLSVDAPITVEFEGDNKPVVSRGGTTELKVKATSMAKELSYQWFKYNSDTNSNELIDGADKSVYKVENVQETTRYTCTVTNEYGLQGSSSIYVQMEGDFTLVPHISLYLVEPGDDVNIEVSPTTYAYEDVAYQWYGPVANQQDIPELIAGATERSYRITNIQKSGYYLCQGSINGITRKCWVRVWICSEIHIENEEGFVYLDRGETAVLSVKATSVAGDLSYQWYVDTAGTGVIENSQRIEGATESTLVVKEPIGEITNYYCVITDIYGNSDYDSRILCLNEPLTARQNKYEQYVTFGDSRTLSLTAEGFGEISYQWSVRTYSHKDKNWTDWKVIEDQKSSIFVIEDIKADTEVQCIVSSTINCEYPVRYYLSVQSEVVVNAVGDTYVQVYPGASATFEVDACSTDNNYSIQWYKQVSDDYGHTAYKAIDGETMPTCTIKNIYERGIYRCEVRDDYNASNSLDFYISSIINDLSAEPDGDNQITVPVGECTVLKVNATCYDGDVDYRWIVNGLTDTTVMGDEYKFESIEQNAEVYCLVADQYGNSTYVYFNISIDNEFTATAENNEIKVKPLERATLRVNATAKKDGFIYHWYQWKESDDGEDYFLIEDADGSFYDTEKINSETIYYCRVEDQYENSVNVYFDVCVDNELTVNAEGDTNRIVKIGDDLILKVNASVYKGEVNYQWIKDNEIIDGENEDILKISNVDNHSRYICNVYDEYGNSNSVWFNIRVDNGLTVENVGDEEQTVELGEGLMLEVKATVKKGNITCRWYKDSQIIEGATGTSIETGAINYHTFYRCVVIDEYGNSDAIIYHIYVENGLTAVAVESEIEVKPGEKAALQISAIADRGDIKYTWYEGYLTEYGWSIREIDGGEGNIYETGEIDTYSRYECYVKDDYGNIRFVEFSISIDNELTVKAIGDTELTVEAGGSAELEVEALANTGEIKYSWRKITTNSDGSFNFSIPIEDATQPKLIVDDIRQVTTYFCKVEDIYGNISETCFQINIYNELTAVSEGEGNLTVKPGDDVTLKVKASVLTGKINYRWNTYKMDYGGNGGTFIRISDATGDTCEIRDIQRSGTYWCVATDQFGNSQAVYFEITIENGLTASAVEPSVHYVEAGKNTTLAVNASCITGELIYNWSTGNSSLSIGNESRLTIEAPELMRQYYCTVMDQYDNYEEVIFTVFTGEIPTLELDKHINAVISGREEIAFYSFIPEITGAYTIESSGDMDSYVELYDANWSIIAQDLESGENDNFKLKAQLTAGVQYYYGVRFHYMDASGIGIIPFTLTMTSAEPDVVKPIVLKNGQNAEMPAQEGFGALIDLKTDDEKIVSVSGSTLTAGMTGTANVTVNFADGQIVYEVTVAETDNTLTVPAGMMTVEEEAFYGNTAIAFVELSDKMQMVEKNAFANSGLYQIVFAGKDTVLSESAFGDLKPTIICVEGSKAEQFALANDFEFLYLP